MGEKQPDISATGRPDAADPARIPSDIDVWFRQFINVLEENIVAAASAIPQDAHVGEFRMVAARAAFQALLEGGMDRVEIIKAFGEAVGGTDPRGPWNETLNQRRLELIDKDIQQSLTVPESFELARLTSLMRAHVDSELNLPMEGVRELHRKLVEQNTTGNPE